MLGGIPSFFGALPRQLRCEQPWQGQPMVGQLIAADLWLVDAAGKRLRAAAWRGRPARVLVQASDQRSYAVRLDADGIVCEVEPLN